MSGAASRTWSWKRYRRKPGLPQRRPGFSAELKRRTRQAYPCICQKTGPRQIPGAGFSLQRASCSGLIIPLLVILQNGSGNAIDGVLVLHAARLELHLIFQPAIVPVPFHLHFGGLALGHPGVAQGGLLGGLLANVGGGVPCLAVLTGVTLPMAVDLVLQNRARAAVHRVLILRCAAPELQLILQPSIVPLPLNLPAGDLLRRQPRVVQSGLLGGVLTNVLLRARRRRGLGIGGLGIGIGGLGIGGLGIGLPVFGVPFQNRARIGVDVVIKFIAAEDKSTSYI